MNIPKRAITDKEIERCFDVMVELRPHLKRSEFLSIVRDMEKEGYKLAYIENGEKVVAVTGYRIYANFFMGKHLYVDDLVTVEESRSKGYGDKLIKWLREEAINSGCNFINLDSGTHRFRAHKFYYKQGFAINSFHFNEQLEPQT